MSDAPSTATRAWAAHRIRQARTDRGVSWAELAEVVGRSLVWTTSALLGQQPLDADQAAAVTAHLGLGDDVTAALLLRPVRGSAAVDRTEPVVYRLEEAVQVYGAAIAELIAEEFGDGIMSAIDFEMDFARVPDAKGDRVVLTWNGKFLPYRTW